MFGQYLSAVRGLFSSVYLSSAPFLIQKFRGNLSGSQKFGEEERDYCFEVVDFIEFEHVLLD